MSRNQHSIYYFTISHNQATPTNSSYQLRQKLIQWKKEQTTQLNTFRYYYTPITKKHNITINKMNNKSSIIKQTPSLYHLVSSVDTMMDQSENIKKSIAKVIQMTKSNRNQVKQIQQSQQSLKIFSPREDKVKNNIRIQAKYCPVVRNIKKYMPVVIRKRKVETGLEKPKIIFPAPIPMRTKFRQKKDYSVDVSKFMRQLSEDEGPLISSKINI